MAFLCVFGFSVPCMAYKARTLLYILYEYYVFCFGNKIYTNTHTHTNTYTQTHTLTYTKQISTHIFILTNHTNNNAQVHSLYSTFIILNTLTYSYSLHKYMYTYSLIHVYYNNYACLHTHALNLFFKLETLVI